MHCECEFGIYVEMILPMPQQAERINAHTLVLWAKQMYKGGSIVDVQAQRQHRNVQCRFEFPCVNISQPLDTNTSSRTTGYWIHSYCHVMKKD